MTIKDALAQRIPRVRKATWAADVYLRLPLLADGGYGPWAELHDDRTQRDVLHIRPGSQRVLSIEPAALHEPGYEVYGGIASRFEHESLNFASTYAEG